MQTDRTGMSEKRREAILSRQTAFLTMENHPEVDAPVTLK
jgi:hypothetical protein